MDGYSVDTLHKQIPWSPVSRRVLVQGVACGPGADPLAEDGVNPMDLSHSDD